MKAPEQLKNLRYEDFAAPNKVLCYGGGGCLAGVGPYMLACGINIVGIIDANKNGSIEICGKKLPVYTIEDALEYVGHNATIIITIANEEIIRQVEEDLIRSGFTEGKIYDLNVWSWLTMPSEKSYCPSLGGYMQFMQCALSNCCNTGVVDTFLNEWFVEGRPIEKSVENFLARQTYYVEQSKKGRIPLYCKGCSFLSEHVRETCHKIKEFIISDHAVCNADCVYCGDACSEPKKQIGATVEKRYHAIINALDTLQQEDLLDEHAVLQVAGGEITINPFRQQLYDTVRKSPGLEIQFLSNCFIYDSEIADILFHNKNAFLMCDLDAGTPETYIKVKGFNKFGIVRENLKKYSQYGRVKVKYIILPGWNDTDADYQGTIELMKYLGIGQLQLSPEFNTSRENDRAAIREILFAAARFMALLKENAMEAVMPAAFWQKKHTETAKRLCHELQALKVTD